jgi:hypothetical protein
LRELGSGRKTNLLACQNKFRKFQSDSRIVHNAICTSLLFKRHCKS